MLSQNIPSMKGLFFTTEEIDDFQTHTFDACPDCGGILTLVKNSSRVVQQVEIVEKSVNIEQHTSLCYWCEQPAADKKPCEHAFTLKIEKNKQVAQ